MKFAAFIFNWPGHEQNASALERDISALIKTTVINSDSNLAKSHPHWVHLDDSAYFSEQWNKACELFNADVLFHIQADAQFDQFQELFAAATLAFAKLNAGIYEPNVDFTDITYDRTKLTPVLPQVFEVPITDCTCWFVLGSVLKQLPKIDVEINKFGWGICGALGAIAIKSGKRCLRDYNFTVNHPQSRGYGTMEALHQRDAYITSQTAELQEAVADLRKQRALLK